MVRFETEESAFNFAVEYLKDISNTLKVCKAMRLKGDIDGWMIALQTLYAELAVKTNEKEEEEINMMFRYIYPFLNDKYTKVRQKPMIMFLLNELEIKLRKKLQDKGMLLPSKADPRFAILER